MDKEVSLDSTKEAERLVGLVCKVSTMYLQCAMFEGSFTEERTVSGKDIFERGFKFSALVDLGVIGEILRSNQGVIRE